MDRNYYLLLHEVFAYEVAVQIGCGNPTIKEFDARLNEKHVDALLHFAAQLQCKLEARVAAVPAGAPHQ